jgi:transposase
MSIIGAFDVHRRQLTFDYVDTQTGAWRRGRVMPAHREHLRAWLARLENDAGGEFAVEGCTGWRYVVEELRAAGFVPHLAEPADTAALRGKKRHAKTDKTDCAHLRAHLLAGDLPESWIPPSHVLEARAVARLYKDLLDERGAWHQRIAATLFHQGAPMIGSMAKPAGRAALAEAGIELSPAGWQAVQTGLRQVDRLTGELKPVRRQLQMLCRRQAGCRALRAAHYGIGPITAVSIWAEMGDVRRFANSDDAVRHHRPRHHRVLLGHQTRRRSPVPARPTAAALGAIRGRQMRGPTSLARPRLLPSGSRPPTQRWAGHLGGSPQTRSPLLPHPSRAGRTRTQTGRLS